MPRHSSRETKLYNLEDALHNLNRHDEDEDEYRMNYLFMKNSPIYVRLEQKYKAMKKIAREREVQIEILNRQFFELAERYSLERSNNSEKHRYAYTARTPEFCEDFNTVKSALSGAEATNENVLGALPLNDYTYGENPHSLDVKQEPLSLDNKPQPVCLDVVLTDNIDIPDTLAIPQIQIIVEEEEQVEDEQEEEQVEVVDPLEKKVEVIEIVEEEQIEEETEEQIEEATDEVEEQTEEEEEGVYETVINETRYYITNDINGEIYAILDDDDIGDIVGKYVEGKPIFE